MKKFLLASVGLVIIGVGSASAADMPRRDAGESASLCRAGRYNWNGPYLGINGGYGFAGTHSGDGGLVGGTLGYNYQSGPWVFGLEGDMNWTHIKGVRAPAAASPARPKTIGWVPRAAVLAMPWDRPVASCPISPAAPPSAISRIQPPPGP